METAKFGLISKDILPIKGSQRVISGFGFFNIWVGMAVIVATFMIGSIGIQSMSVGTLLIAIFVANLVIAILGSLNGDIGMEHGLSFAVYMRAPFGTIGTHIPSVSRGIVASIWFGIQTYLGALAINEIVRMTTGWDNWWFWYLSFAAIQVIFTSLGIKAVERLAFLAAPTIIIVSIWMYFTMSDMATAKGTPIWEYVGTSPGSFWIVLFANMGFWSALAIDIPNITRYIQSPKNEKNWFRRNKNNFIPHITALPIVQTFMGLIGAAAFLATGDWNPINAIIIAGSGLTLFIVLLMVVLAQWSTNNAANLIPAGMTYINAGAKINMPYWAGIALAGIVGILCQPHLILNQLFVYLGAYGAILSAVCGILIVDYYIIRKRRVNVEELFRNHGQYRYWKGINPAGMIAWIIGGGLALYFRDYMYFIGLGTGGILYYILMKTWVLKKYPQKEVESGFSDEYLGVSVGKENDFDHLLNIYEKYRNSQRELKNSQ
jgi:NCS1 family nucleobase:cation symporter-1